MVVKKSAKQRAAEKAEKRKKVEWQKHFARIRREGKQSDREKVRVTEPPINKIKRAGTLSLWEETAADELMDAYAYTMGAHIRRDPSTAVKTNKQFGAQEDFAATQSDLSRAYQRWRADLADTREIAIAVAVLFADVSLTSLDRKYRKRSGYSAEHLVRALRHFAAIRGNTPRGAHTWKLTLPAR